MTAARKPNDTIAMMTVNLAVSSIGSSPFRLEGCPCRNRQILLARLSCCQAVSLLHRTKDGYPKLSLTTSEEGLGFMDFGNFFDSRRLRNRGALGGACGKICRGRGEFSRRTGPIGCQRRRTSPRASGLADRERRRLREHGAVERLLERLDQLALAIGLDIEPIILVGDAHQIHDGVPTGPGIS